jgi:hypothetical protein
MASLTTPATPSSHAHMGEAIAGQPTMRACTKYEFSRICDNAVTQTLCDRRE